MGFIVKSLISDLEHLPSVRMFGRVESAQGLLVEAGGLNRSLSVGDHCQILGRSRQIICEVVGFRNGRALLMPFSSLEGVSLGGRVELLDSSTMLFPHGDWRGRVVGAMGQPLDGKGPLPVGEQGYPVRAAPPPTHGRQRVAGKVDLGVRAMNTFLTTCRGQRMGIFAGSGIGKSSLLSMMARHTSADVSVIGLIGERGRETREFIEDDLGPEGMARSVVIVATSDESALLRRQAAFVTMAVAEYFRDQGQQVLCLMDSVTRFA
ncbi:MAG TPA: flagellum-specific ATP synthase FliI, partial [Rhodospirillaceae bacterium]|nr:flagellum-specific ATP synthase FliI [Rhodospirillaceae bacterium]